MLSNIFLREGCDFNYQNEFKHNTSAESRVEFKAKIFRALGDVTRLKIMYFLRGGERCVCEIIPYTGYAQPTVSRHLKVLTDCGVLRVRKDGNKRLYSITDPGIFKVLDSIDAELMRSLSQKLIRHLILVRGR